MSVLNYLILFFIPIATVTILIILLIKVRSKYANNLGNVATNPQMFVIIIGANIVEFWLIGSIPDPIIILLLFVAAVILFLLLKLSTSYFDRYQEPIKYSIFGGIMVVIISLVTPFLTYAIAYKEGSLILYSLYVLINSSLAIAFSIFIVRLVNKLHITSK